MIIHSDVSRHVIGAFFDAYNGIGFGYPESFCLNALSVELQLRGIAYAREVPVEVLHHGVPLGRFRLDMVVDGRLLIEVKASKALTDADRRQTQSYLKASHIQVGLLLHFGPKPQYERFIYTKNQN